MFLELQSNKIISTLLVCGDLGGGLGGEPSPEKAPSLPSHVLSPLATLSFELCVVSYTGFKTGLVGCRHGLERGGSGLGDGGAIVQILASEFVCMSFRGRASYTSTMSKFHLPHLKVNS